MGDQRLHPDLRQHDHGGGSLADRLGRRRVFAWGLALFTLDLPASLAFVPNVLALNLLRAAQGVAAALTMAGAGASLASQFEGQARARAYGILGTSFGVGLAFGPLLAGALIEHFGWRSTFVAAAIASLAALVLGVPKMRESSDPGAKGVEWAGMVTFTATLLIYELRHPRKGRNGAGRALARSACSSSSRPCWQPLF